MGSHSDELRIQIRDLEQGRDSIRDENAELKSRLERMVPVERLAKADEEKKALEAEFRKMQETLQKLNEASRSKQVELERLKEELERANASLKLQLEKASEDVKNSNLENQRLRNAEGSSKNEIESLKRQVHDIHWQTVAALKPAKGSEKNTGEPAQDVSKQTEADRLPQAQLAEARDESSNSQTSILTVEYLRTILLLLKKSRESENADSRDLETAKKQEKTLEKMKNVWNARLKTDDALRIKSEKSVHFDSQVDDDEVLLRLFAELDIDKNGSVSLVELLNSPMLSKEQNKEMAKVLRKALQCDFEIFEEALLFLGDDEFGKFKKPIKKDSIAAVYEAAVNSPHATVPPSGSHEWKSRLVTLESIRPLLEQLRGGESPRLLSALEELASGLTRPDQQGELSFLTLKSAARKLPRVSGQRMEWARSLGLDGALARHLPPGTLDDGLEGLKRMDSDAIDKALKAFCEDAILLFKTSMKMFRETKGSTSAVEANSKFEGFTGNFASLTDYHQGAEETMKLGYPNPDLDKGIMTDHIAHPCVKRIFVTPNYQIATCLMLEYWWAVDPTFLERPKEAFAQASHHEARQLLKQLRVARGSVREGEKGIDDIIFPGEVGDTFFETLIILAVRGRVNPSNSGVSGKDIASTIDWSKQDGLLETDEEKVRGVKMLSHFECRAWQHKNSAMRMPMNGNAIESRVEADVKSSLEVVGVILPMCRDRAAEKSKVMKDIVTNLEPKIPGIQIEIEVIACKTLEFCGRTSIDVFRKHLEDLSLPELKKIAAIEFSIADVLLKNHSRDSLCNVLEETFFQKELRPSFKLAMQSASGMDLSKLPIFSAWGLQVRPGSTTEEVITLAFEALNSLERWKDVADWVELYHGRIQGRTKLSLRQLIENQRDLVSRYKMQDGEVLAAYLYTGPNFVPYNSIYRSFPPNMVELLKGDENTPRNTMSTTLFCISSALVKLGRNTELPESRKVYRGLGKMLLPQQFWVEHGTPAWKGGVERAIMSTTSDKDVALYYSGGKGMVVEISVGRIQIGGDVGWLSMYPGEKEITFPPFTCLESDGEPRVERTARGEIVLFPLKASVNAKAETSEDLQGRRKRLHVGMCKLVREDISLQAEQTLREERYNESVRDLVKQVMEEVDALSKQHASHEIKTFNDDAQYKKLTAEAIDAKSFALKKIKFFVESMPSGLEDKTLLKRIFDRPFMDFAHASTELELKTGSSGFPWSQVTKQSASIDFGDWRPGTLSQGNVDIMIGAMAENFAMRQISVRSEISGELHRLFFADGWKTNQIKWAKQKAVEHAPDIVSMLLRSCEKIVSLNLSSINLGSEGSRMLSIALQKLTDLEDLDLSSCNLGSEGAKNVAEAMESLSSLKTINLRENQLSAEDWTGITGSLQHCAKLGDIKDFEWSKDVLAPSVTALDLRNKKLCSVGAATLMGLLPWAAKTLTNLDISANDIESTSCTLIAQNLRKLANLEVLNLSDNELASDVSGCKELNKTLDFNFLPKIRILHLHGIGLTDQGSEALCGGLGRLTRLRTLGLSWNEIGELGCTALGSSLQPLTSLSILHLHGNKINDVGLQRLTGGLSKLVALETLDLHNNLIGKVGFEALGSALAPLTKLQTMDLRGNKIDDDRRAADEKGHRIAPHAKRVYI